MDKNHKIQALFDGLRAAGVQARCNWQARRDGQRTNFARGIYPDVEHLAFVGDGFAPSISTAILIDYSGEGYGLYIEANSNLIADDVAMIAKPRPMADAKPADPAGALAKVESFIEGFEDDDLQEGIPELLAGLRAAMKRQERAEFLLAESLDAWEGEEESVQEEHEDLIADLKAFVEGEVR